MGLGRRAVLATLSEEDVGPAQPTARRARLQLSTLLRVAGLKHSSIQVKKGSALIDTEDPIGTAEAVSRMPGIDYAAVVEVVPSGYEDVVHAIVKVGRRIIYPGETFSVKVELGKGFPYRARDVEFNSSAQLIGELGKGGARISAKRPLKTIYARVEGNEAYIFYFKYAGPGGRLVGSQGEALCPLFGDRESGVAAWMAARHGIFPHLLLFDHRPHASQVEVGRIISMASIIREALPVVKCYVAAFRVGPMMDLLKRDCPERVLPYIFRRMMLRLCCTYADRLGVGTIIMGGGGFDVLEGMFEVASAYHKQLLFPTMGLSRDEITDYSKRIGIFRASKGFDLERGPWYPPHRPPKKLVEDVEARLDVQGLIKENLGKVKLLEMKRGFDDIHEILNKYFRS